MTLPEETSKGSALPAYEPSSIRRAIDDAKALREATSGLRTDKKIPNPNISISLLQQTYTQLYHRGLEDDILGHIPSSFKDAILGMIKGPIWCNGVADPRVQFGLFGLVGETCIDLGALHYIWSDVERLRYLSWEERPDMVHFVLCQVIFYRTQAKPQAIKEMYAEKCSEPLIERVKWLLLIMYLETVRCEDGTDALDTQSIRVDAQLLHQGIWRKGEDIDHVLDILARSSRERLIALMDEFRARYNINLVDYIEEKINGGFQFTLR
ncbi:hypothetical protein N7522_005587 [Penicillium canescens]|nr:hypothetical protein N7522_005587 [Penicillium canescens]